MFGIVLMWNRRTLEIVGIRLHMNIYMLQYSKGTVTGSEVSQLGLFGLKRS